MSVIEPMDFVLRLKFEAAIQEHVAKKATNKRMKAAAKKRAEELREQARQIEHARASGSVPG